MTFDRLSVCILDDPKPPKPPVLETNLGPETDFSVREGSSVKLTCDPQGAFKEIRWYKDGKPLVGENKRVLKVESFSADDEGRYWCTTSNEDGESPPSNTKGLKPIGRQIKLVVFFNILSNV